MKFLNSYKAKLFLTVSFMSIVFICFSSLISGVFFINLIKKALLHDNLLAQQLLDLTPSYLFQSFKTSFALVLIPILIASVYISMRLASPIISFSNKLNDMKETDDLYILNEEGLNEFKQLASNWNYLLDHTINVKERNELLEHQSDIDGLTKLYNHRYFYEKLEYTIENSSSQVSLIFFDIDKFKSINDTYGHLTGDKVLIVVAKLIKSTLIKEGFAKSSLVARYGGEEITVLLNNIDKDSALQIAEKIRVRISKSVQIKNIIPERIVTISAGVSNIPKDTDNITDLIEKADIAMYFSKNNGRNQSTLYTPQIKNIKNKSNSN